ncbi:hypothetical protein EUX98_g2719 [Antrodiella citrinella]|uniref:Uncharacterized protein n=1 Tax=Antrodiella citrinella TaxID=2447956 RepID=A0A4S4N6K3_9APHY|nr:hypothetical protein EUX98_g2719 [Antrodiella citrinella]
MYETLIRPHQVDVVPSLPTIDTISAQLKQSEARREAKRLRQIANSKQARGEKRKREPKEDPARTDDDTGAAAMDVDVDVDEEEGSSAKKTKTETDAAVENQSETVIPAASSNSPAPVIDEPQVLSREQSPEPAVPTKISVSKAFPEVRGHTSYLTFALLLPQSAMTAAMATPLTDANGVLDTETVEMVKSKPADS